MTDVVYDACVLYSAVLRDLLMTIAVAELVHAHWSDDIHDEWIRSLLRNRPDLKRSALERTRREMDQSVIGGLVKGYEPIIPTLHLPDPNDRHVLAVAIHVGASVIVTRNLGDFPSADLLPYHVEAISPDEFVLRLIQDKPYLVLKTVRQIRTGLARPPKTVDEYLATLEKQQLTRTLAFLREHRDEI